MRITLPYSGELLLSHLAAYGLAATLHAGGARVDVGHDAGSQSYEPFVDTDAEPSRVLERVRASAVAAVDVVERDIEAGKRGNDRRAVIWSRASFANDPSLAMRVQSEQAAIADTTADPVVAGLLAGLGMTAPWAEKPSYGATALDGVLGNHTSDFVRGVLRPAHKAAAVLDPEETRARWASERPVVGDDKTGWVPPPGVVHPVDQWLAALGLSLLPVAHRRGGKGADGRFRRSRTRATMAEAGGARRQFVVLPVLSEPVSLARLRGLLASELLADRPSAGRRQLEAMGVGERVWFEAERDEGSSSSVRFTFGRGEREDLRWTSR